MKDRLTVKQEKFCINYFESGNAASAATLAGYSIKSIRSIASEILTNPNIKARIKALQEKAESAKIATVQERKQILTEILRAKLTDYIELGKDGSWVNIGPETPQSRAIQEIHSRTEYDENGEHPTIHTSVKLINPIEAIKELNKMEGVYPSERIDITSKGNEIKPQIVFQVVNIETQNILNRIQNGERTEPLEINNGISTQCTSIPESTETQGAE